MSEKRDVKISNSKTNPNDNNNNKGTKFTICKGGLYHSSNRKSLSKDPFCLGFTRTFHQVLSGPKQPPKKAVHISYFKYGCVGYSAYCNKDDPASNLRDEPAICLGFELIVRKWSDGAAAHAHKKQEARSSSSESDKTPDKMPASVEPSPSPSYNFQKRFERNLLVVASGVGKSAVRVGYRIKNRLVNAIDPYRKRDD